MKAAAGLALLLGLTLFAALTLYEGAGDVARAFTSIGFGALWIVLIRMAQTFLSSFAWRALIARPRPLRGFSSNCAGCANRSMRCCPWRRSAAI